jgi:CHAT domain-containing protein
MSGNARTFYPITLLGLVLLLGGCATGSGVLGERDTALVTSRYEELERIGERETAGLKQIPSPKLMPLCVAYGKLKRYNKLFPCLDKLEDNVRRGDKRQMDFEEFQRRNPLMAGLALMGSGVAGGREGLEGNISIFPFLMRAEAYIDLARYAEAVEQAKKAVANIPTQWNQERWARIMSTSMLGLAYALGGDRENTLKTATELENISVAYPFTLLRGDKGVGLAKIYLALKDYPKALSAMEEGKDTLFGSFAKGVADAFAVADTKGEGLWVWQDLPREFVYNKTLFEVGRVNEAKAGYDKLLGIPQTKENGDLYWVILFDRGRIAEKDGNRAQAVELYRKAVDVIEGQRATLNTEASKIGFVGDKQAVYQYLVAALLAESRNAEAFEFVERAKSRALVDMLAAKQDFAVHTVNAQQVRTLLAQVNTTESEARIQGGDAAIAGKRSLAVQLRRDLQTQAPELASLVNVTYSSAKDIQARLPADEVLVEYYYDDKKVYAFVITRERLQVVWLEGGNLAQDVKAFREALDSPKDNRYLALAQKLHRQLFQPLEATLTKQHVLIVAHGALHYLPFNALHDGREYVIDRYRLRQLPSASVMPYLRGTRQAKTGTLLAFGNPDLGDKRYDLAYAQAEAQAITRVVPGARALVRRDATETAFKQQGVNYAYVHFASHGEFNADAPLNSALLLAKDKTNDGALTVGELYSMRLNADLVTLSACETGLGKIANGDDVVGLTRGFLYAGSRSIVASLWKVDDEATAYLMTRFYGALKGTSKREALRLAQIETRKKYVHPYYWAAFQLTGEAS